MSVHGSRAPPKRGSDEHDGMGAAMLVTHKTRPDFRATSASCVHRRRSRSAAGNLDRLGQLSLLQSRLPGSHQTLPATGGNIRSYGRLGKKGAAEMLIKGGGPGWLEELSDQVMMKVANSRRRCIKKSHARRKTLLDFGASKKISITQATDSQRTHAYTVGRSQGIGCEGESPARINSGYRRAPKYCNVAHDDADQRTARTLRP